MSDAIAQIEYLRSENANAKRPDLYDVISTTWWGFIGFMSVGVSRFF